MLKEADAALSLLPTTMHTPVAADHIERRQAKRDTPDWRPMRQVAAE